MVVLKETYTPLLKLEIPIPMTAERHYGVHSVLHEEGARLYVRANGQENALIEEACKILDNMPVGSFLRSAGVNAAKVIVEHYHAYLKSSGGG